MWQPPAHYPYPPYPGVPGGGAVGAPFANFGYPYPYMYPHPGLPAKANEPLKKKRGRPSKRKKRNKQAKAEGAPKRPATAFVMFSNQHRQEVKDANPQLTMVEIAKKLGEMWRGMEQDVRKEWEEKATSAKDHYMDEKKLWLEQRQAVQAAGPYGEAV
eukprot:Tamp_19049.p1 GENE.Tamp_19049~~Tamp_19049.p1  ORF type:complete len:158 (+),score=39.73 Tamp_19049:70-543(+)